MHGIETIKRLNDKCTDERTETEVVAELMNSNKTEVDLPKGSNVRTVKP